jgi:hypothetical protein
MDPEQNELTTGQDVPFAFRMMENIPGITASLGFAQFRGSNTLLRGGFQDNRRKGPGKLGGFTKSGDLVGPKSSAFYGTKARRSKLASGQAVTRTGQIMPFGKGARVNHVTARPRALTRYNSLAMFQSAENARFYSPFQMAAKLGGKQAVKNQAFKTAVYGAAGPAEGEQVFQRGMISMITAGRRADLIERRAVGGSARATKKLATAQEQVRRLAGMNNASLTASKTFTGGQFGRVLPKSAGAGLVLPAGQTLTTASPMTAALAGGNKVGLTGNLMASAGATQGSRFVQGYFRGALGNVGAGGLMDEALTGANRAVSHLGMALDRTGKAGLGIDDAGRLTGRFASTYEGKAAQALEKGVFKTLGVKRTMQAAATKKGAMVLGARTAAMAIPGLNLLATASLVYDLGKMGGEVVKSGINLAKDAVKSMKGSIDKPSFGMGYKDNEVAATSRARGVMAIQNSRLNARSALGSEGAMMASHFG